MADPSSERWRAIVAALLNPRARRVLGEVLTAEDAPPLGDADRGRAEAMLSAAGLLTADGRLDEIALRALLAARTPAPTGVDRWLRDGVVATWPSTPADRDELLAWVLPRVIGHDEHLDERTLTERLGKLTRDPLRLRRALVDVGLLDREVDGTDYRRGASAPAEPPDSDPPGSPDSDPSIARRPGS